MLTLQELEFAFILNKVYENNANICILQEGQTPYIQIDSRQIYLHELGILTFAQMEKLTYEIVSENANDILSKGKQFTKKHMLGDKTYNITFERKKRDFIISIRPAYISKNIHPNEFDINDLLNELKELNGSDLHLISNCPPYYRINKKIKTSKSFPSISSNRMKSLLIDIIPERLKNKIEAKIDIDFSYTFTALGRYRVNIFYQRDSLGAVFRSIPEIIFPHTSLGININIIESLALKQRGLVLVTGPVNSGKTTTLNSMIDYRKKCRADSIITLEDPIEYVHSNSNSNEFKEQGIIIQREVGKDVIDFATGLKSALRQDPDVILIGELRDKETVSTALTAAETGHLVLSTLHTSSSIDTIDRIIDFFPYAQHAQIRSQLASNLQGIISQILIPRADNTGLALASEILIQSTAVKNIIREGKTPSLIHAIESGEARELGMISLERSLQELYNDNIITYEQALEKAINPIYIKQTC